MRLTDHTFRELVRGLERLEFSSRDLVEAALDADCSHLPDRVSFIRTADRERALARAAGVDDARARGETLGPLAGLPIAVKDNISTRGLGTTCGSRSLEGYDPPYDATAVERIASAGAILIGKTNMDEFAMGSSTTYSAYGGLRNPWDATKVAGGSSGGSAVAVAAGQAALALGSDTGGSVRQPAGFCGVVGAKPTYGRVSRYGLVAFASSFDQIGPMARDVEGCAALLEVIAGFDPRDATSLREPVPDCVTAAGRGVKGLTLGVPREFLGDAVDDDVRVAVERALRDLERAGASVVSVSIPSLRHAVAAYYLIADAEASANLARYDGVSYGRRAGADDLDALIARSRDEGFGLEVKRRVMLGTFALSAGYRDRYYARAQSARRQIAGELFEALAGVDALVGPVAPTAAFGVGEIEPLAMYLSDILTIPANLAEVPAISVPCGLTDAGLPVGLQVIVDRLEEPTMFAVAGAVERAAGGPPAPPVPYEDLT